MEDNKLTYYKAYKELKKHCRASLKSSKQITRSGKPTDYCELNDYLLCAENAIEMFNFYLEEWIVDNQNGFETIFMKLIHESGQETQISSKSIHVTEDMQKNGSSQTYARRYLLQILLGVHGEADDDGEDTTAKPKAEREISYSKDATITEGQNKMLWAKIHAYANQFNKNANDIANSIKEAYGITDTKRLLAAQLEGVLKKLTV